jgi:YidC/Oxa1 family membrane protein insertase
MAKTLISSPPFIGTPLPSPRHGFLHTNRRPVTTRIKLSFHENLPPINSFDSPVDFSAILTRTEGLLYTLADAAVATADSASTSAADAAVQKNNGWFGFISDAMEVVLKVNNS